MKKAQDTNSFALWCCGCWDESQRDTTGRTTKGGRDEKRITEVMVDRTQESRPCWRMIGS